MGAENPLLRRLPAVDRILAEPGLQGAVARYGHAMVRDAVRQRLHILRDGIQGGKIDAAALQANMAAMVGLIQEDLEAALRDPYRRVINASGILVHTNLGRAPLSWAATEAARRAGRHGVALEYDLQAGARGSRARPVQTVLEELFPGKAGLVVSNNAAAVLLALNSIARNREVVISRGELVEIGGSFRVPEIMEKSGARLVEVGTTNRTRAEDYRQALSPETAAILRVHPSNFTQVGFTESASARELKGVAAAAGVLLVVDQGSGNLHELGPYGIRDEPTVASVLEEGADLVTFSGDKLLGGPQAGLVVGEPQAVARLAANPLARALRPDKLILASLVETLRCHQQGRAFEEIPILRRLATPVESLQERSGRLLERLAAAGMEMERVSVENGVSRSGGGSSPSGQVPTVLLCLQPSATGEDALAERLRQAEPAVVGRLAGGRLLLDLRTVDPEEDELLGEALIQALELQRARGTDS